MKTKSLSKAKMGSVQVVLEPNQLGYSSLGEIPYDERPLHEVIADIYRELKTASKELQEQRNENEALKEELRLSNVEIEALRTEIAKNRKAIEETLKGLITR